MANGDVNKRANIISSAFILRAVFLHAWLSWKHKLHFEVFKF